MNQFNEFEQIENPRRVYRFDIFKGASDSNGKIQKVKSVGYGLLYDGTNTYNVQLKTLLNEHFFLLPEKKNPEIADFVILTREPSTRPGRKYFWNNVGNAKVMSGVNVGTMKMDWDMLACEDVYMNLHPLELPAKTPAYVAGAEDNAA